MSAHTAAALIAGIAALSVAPVLPAMVATLSALAAATLITLIAPRRRTAGVLATAMLLFVTALAGAPHGRTEAAARLGAHNRLSGEDIALTERVFSVHDDRGLAAAVSEVRRLDPPRIHEIMHALGSYAFERGRDLSAVWRECVDDYTYGCVHGVAWSMLQTRDLAPDDVPGLCAFADSALPGSSRQCWHEMTHVLNDRLGTDWRALAPYCDKIPDQTGHQECWRSALKASLLYLGPGNIRAVVPREDPASYCLDVPEDHRKGCWQALPRALAALEDDDWTRALSRCEEVPAGDARLTCFRSAGSLLRELYPEQTLAQVLAVCASATSTSGRDFCRLGALEFLLVTPQEAAAVCRAEPAGEFRTRCAWVVAVQIKQRHPESEWSDTCRRLLPQDEDECRRGLTAAR